MHSKYFLILILYISCSTNENVAEISKTTLSDYLSLNVDKTLDEVIACAGSNRDLNEVLLYYFPEEGSFDFKYYETTDTNIDPNDFSKYNVKDFPIEGVFGNKLSAFKRNDLHDAWGIVTYKTEGKIHLSNPIRIKHQIQPTVYNSEVTIDSSVSLSPQFSWNESETVEDAIYFQVLLSENNTFISGTYTFDPFFRYYDITNLVLTINTTTPPELILASNYQFTVLGVSKDNWVNTYSNKNFTVE